MSWLLLAVAIQFQAPDATQGVKLPPPSSSQAPVVQVWTISFKRGSGVPIDILKQLPRETQFQLLALSKKGAPIEIYDTFVPPI